MTRALWLALPLLALSCSKGPEAAPRTAVAKAPVEKPFDPTPPQREVHLKRPPTPDPAGFVGTWRSQDTTARVRISREGEAWKIEAWDGQDGERFLVDGVRLEEGALHSDWTMPSTDHRTHAALRIEGLDRLEEECSGGWRGTITWRRDGDSSPSK